MFSRICVGSNDLTIAKTFYDAVFGTMGATPREFPFGTLHLAYLRDPDSNKLCAMYRVG